MQKSKKYTHHNYHNLKNVNIIKAKTIDINLKPRFFALVDFATHLSSFKSYLVVSLHTVHLVADVHVLHSALQAVQAFSPVANGTNPSAKHAVHVAASVHVLQPAEHAVHVAATAGGPVTAAFPKNPSLQVATHFFSSTNLPAAQLVQSVAAPEHSVQVASHTVHKPVPAVAYHLPALHVKQAVVELHV